MSDCSCTKHPQAGGYQGVTSDILYDGDATPTGFVEGDLNDFIYHVTYLIYNMESEGALFELDGETKVKPRWGRTMDYEHISEQPTSADYNLSELGDVDDTDKGGGKILKVGEDGITHVYVVDETGTDEKVKYDAADPTAGYLSAKIVAGTNMSIIEGTGVNENKAVFNNTYTYIHPTSHPMSIIDESGVASGTPIDASRFHFWDTVNSLWKAITWTNIKSTLKTYFDTLYGSLGLQHIQNTDSEIICPTSIKYGYLYNWFVTQGTGDDSITSHNDWSVPTDTNFTTLTDYLTAQGVTDIGSSLAGNYDLWQDGALRQSADFGLTGFNKLPGGYRNVDGSFSSIEYDGSLWSATEFDGTTAWYRDIFYFVSTIRRDSYNKKLGFSIRLVRAASVSEQLLADYTQLANYTGNDETEYKTIKIGTQVWTVECLAETKYRDGDTITEVTNDTAWSLLSTGGRCSYENDANNTFGLPTTACEIKTHINSYEKHLSSAEKIIIGNTSGTNTGDQESSDFDHDNLQNTHNLTTDIDHDQLTNTHEAPLILDQTSPQEIINGIPTLETTRVYTDNIHELVDEKRLNEALVNIGINCYLTDAASGVGTYKLLDKTRCGTAETSVSAISTGVGVKLLGSWKNAELSTVYVAGNYRFRAEAKRDADSPATQRDCRIYFEIWEINATTGADVTKIMTSQMSDVITATRRSVLVTASLADNYEISAGNTCAIKIYADFTGGNKESTLILYYCGDTYSHVEAPSNKEVLDTIYEPLNTDGCDYINVTEALGVYSLNYKAGRTRDDNVVTDVVAGAVVVTDDATNYIEVTGAGVVSANIVGFTEGSIPLYVCIMASGVATVTDRRTRLSIGGGGEDTTENIYSLFMFTNLGINI